MSRLKQIYNKVKSTSTNKKVNWKFDNNDPRRFFFMHIPKTAGTTFRLILNRHAEEGYLWPDQKFLNSNKSKYPQRAELLSTYKNYLNKNILVGHYDIDILNNLPKDTITLTILRNPYERILSHIKHICAVDQKYNGDPNLVLEQNMKQIVYTQSRMLKFQPFNKIGFDNVKKNINRINFIGLTEEFEKSIHLCNKMFDWHLDLIAPQNQRPDKVIEMLSSSNKSLIIKKLIPEIRTYNLASKKFNKLCEQYNV